jgi:hypothetical protein
LAPRPVPSDSGLAVLKLAESHMMGWPIFEKTKWRSIRTRLLWAIYSTHVHPEAAAINTPALSDGAAIPRYTYSQIVEGDTLSENENMGMAFGEHGRKRRKLETDAIPRAVSQLYHLVLYALPRCCGTLLTQGFKGYKHATRGVVYRHKEKRVTGL